MEYLRNYWYCAAWSLEVSRQPLARTLLDEKVVLYRKENGDIIALGDLCPHRFAPLHQGKVEGDVLACRYHGLAFGEGGTCVRNPHGEVIPARLKVKGYPIVERYGAAWIWMGDPTLADDSRIPEFSEHSDPSYRTVYERLPVKGSYQLVSDNLLDLSHTQYLHPFLARAEAPDSRFEFEVGLDGDTVTTIYNTLNVRKGGFSEFVWPDGPDRFDGYSGVRWQPPANMRLKTHMTHVGGPEERARLAWGAELVTPETPTSCHYFWSFARNYRLEDEGFDEALRQAISGVFTNEDATMIASVQENMGSETDLINLKPVILPTDEAAIRARRIVRKLLRDEDAAMALKKKAVR
jgi:phenylpropionate dioxygenase-like ring-hydroxylating dioxygenase large terminal subunit